ncbi:unnamed protein product [Parnassius mnemosyne]|uniref:Uncharacterized protein n=1 Tax=Parnassius mnemosyne TaxID=213953 RepID=A0AAV1KT36_9NEOP
MQRFNGGKSNAVYNIVSGDESWIYSYETERKHQSAVWIFENEVKPTKVIRSRSVSKKMVATFVSKKGHVATIPLQERRTVTAEWYMVIVLFQAQLTDDSFAFTLATREPLATLGRTSNRYRPEARAP